MSSRRLPAGGGKEGDLDKEFPFTIKDIACLLNLHIRHRKAMSWDADCPLCGETKGKLNLNLAKDVFKCNRCGESGGMLALYGKIYGVDNQTAYEEIREALGQDKPPPSYQVPQKETAPKEAGTINAQAAPDKVKDRTYTMLLSMLPLSGTHKQKLLERGFTEGQVERNGYRSTPAFGYRRIAKGLRGAGYIVEGVPGFYREEGGEWTIHFHPKSSGIMIPIRNVEGYTVGIQIRLDRPYDGRKYMWLSSVNYHMGHLPEAPYTWRATPGKGHCSSRKGH
jgi:hypothetical protein